MGAGRGGWMGRAVGPRLVVGRGFLGRCPRLVWRRTFGAGQCRSRNLPIFTRGVSCGLVKNPSHARLDWISGSSFLHFQTLDQIPTYDVAVENEELSALVP